MRNIKYIAVHCTSGWQTNTIADLRQEFKNKGWKNPGYHYVVMADGKIEQMLSEDKVSNGVKGYNSISINVAWLGGIKRGENRKLIPVDNRTEQQKTALRSLLKKLHSKYPKAIIQGHRDFSPDLNHDGRITPNEWMKSCPNFEAKIEYKDIQQS